MGEGESERYERLAALTARVARAVAELQVAGADTGLLAPSQAAELDELADRLQALQVLLANEVERAWNAAEADARQARRAEMMGRVHDAVSAETTLPHEQADDIWQTLGPYRPEGPPEEGLSPSSESR